jgi:hypothetical protein
MADSNEVSVDMKFFKKPASIPAYAEAEGISRQSAALRVRKALEAGTLTAVGVENRDGQGRRGRRPTLYQAQ